MAGERESHTLVYPRHRLQPEDLLNFWELPWFTDSWDQMDLTDEDLSALQILIMCDPKSGDVMQGTRGLRKLRYSPEGWNTGKSHALRVCYVHFEKYGMVLLCLVFRKGEFTNLSRSGKRAANAAIDRIAARLEEKFGF